jgi:hypothetical protein
MPTLCSSTLQSSFLRLQRAFTPTHGRRKIKHESTTMAMRNAGESADMKVITLNKLFGKRTVKCLEIPHYA